ncbi:MAG TPA: hypothetical protein V6C82_04780 [Chroococcales cyanobacterium]
MQIRQVVVERQDGPEYCGLLFYHYQQLQHYVPWTVDLSDPQQLVLKLFPPVTQENAAIVCDHYEARADAIVDRVMRDGE